MGVAAGTKVPVGMGVVVPSHRITEVLEMPDVKKARENALAAFDQDAAARPQSVKPVHISSGDKIPPATDENRRRLHSDWDQ
jgi:hypothetical protein